MCQLSTEGTLYGCGHYVVTRTVDKIDCNDKLCIKSIRHAKPKCPHCPRCDRYFKPDFEQTITQRTKEYCFECEYWYKGEGARRRT